MSANSAAGLRYTPSFGSLPSGPLAAAIRTRNRSASAFRSASSFSFAAICLSNSASFASAAGKSSLEMGWGASPDFGAGSQSLPVCATGAFDEPHPRASPTGEPDEDQQDNGPSHDETPTIEPARVAFHR
jgi:hypothetical protein